MSIRINLIELLENMIESSVDIEVSTDEALRIIMQNFKENVEAGAPKSLIDDHIKAINKTFQQIQNIYNDKILKMSDKND